MAKKEPKEIDVTSLDSELAAAKAVEEGRSDKFIRLAFFVAILMTSFHIFTGLNGLGDYVTQRGIHLSFALTLVLLTQPLHKHICKDKYAGIKPFRILCRCVDLLLIALTWISWWMAQDEVHHLAERLSQTTWMATFAGACLAVITLECARRVLGYIMPVLALIFVAYALAGPHLPLAIAHRGYSLQRICKFLATDLDGLFGTTMSVSATVIFMFVMFGAFLEASGCSDFINEIAISLTGKIKSGPALSAVVASGLMGSINGSAVANVVGTGTFTIPLMKSRGYKPAFAGGVEAVASTGGQILPPVMGSGAFLMVAFTETKYINIVIAAVIPALLYYWGCAVAVVSQSELADIQLMDPKEIPKAKNVLKSGWIYLVIIGVLLYCLLVAQYSPLYSALWATFSVPVVMLFDKKKRFTLKSIIPAMAKSAFSSMSIVIGCACAGIVVGMVSLTGIGVIFGDMMIQAAHSMLFPSLLFTALTCIILGMGLPTTAAYVIAASILAPSLIKLGLTPLTSHLFVFYFACLSAITPPVALAAYAGAGIAKCSPMTTAVEACKLGFAGFMVPFAFCYNPAMMMQGNVAEILSVFISAFIGVSIMSAGFQGWLLWKLHLLERIIFICAGLLMFIPGTLTDITGLAIAIVLIAINMKKWKKVRTAS
ncbi:MAG: TRAP transporter permease [Oscillospiraceae bacterium]|nr:TRAP transporter permease [Oscillospiraceae bacterium]MCM0704715.1 TRAP transporter permease [Faecalicatena sp. BF-R-105]MDY3218029.1 TRAP transporter permease [Candidatus Fimivivens sp.]SFJ43523.1 TRAP transporter, 4TM/12TM fusion protein [Ruminococcaceae bacterium D5]GKH49605.1 C4-dicarboxylate ABC transporter [Eubacteriales bacterium]